MTAHPRVTNNLKPSRGTYHQQHGIKKRPKSPLYNLPSTASHRNPSTAAALSEYTRSMQAYLDETDSGDPHNSNSSREPSPELELTWRELDEVNDSVASRFDRLGFEGEKHRHRHHLHHHHHHRDEERHMSVMSGDDDDEEEEVDDLRRRPSVVSTASSTATKHTDLNRRSSEHSIASSIGGGKKWSLSSASSASVARVERGPSTKKY